MLRPALMRGEGDRVPAAATGSESEGDAAPCVAALEAVNKTPKRLESCQQPDPVFPTVSDALVNSPSRRCALTQPVSRDDDSNETADAAAEMTSIRR